LERSLHRVVGEVTLATPISSKILTVAACGVLVLGLLFASFSEYSRRETVTGWLAPEHGMVRIVATTDSRVVTMHAQEGELVEEGQDVAVVRLDSDLISGGAGAQILAAIQAQINAEGIAATTTLERMEHERSRLEQALAGLRLELDTIEADLEIQSEQQRLADIQVSRAEQLAERGYASGRQLDDRRASSLQARQSRNSLLRSQASLNRQIDDLEAALVELPLEIEAAQARATLASSSLQERILNVETRTEIALTAPISGRVAASQAHVGRFLRAGQTIAVIIPEGEELIAELYIPSRAIGFIEEGQDVRLKYQAFPYQRFGTGEARIVQISDTLVAPSDLPLVGPQMLESVFLVRAEIDSSYVEAYGREFALQPGMLLTADVIVDRRNLLEFLFDPIFAAGR
jgi:membrane fusion protein